MITGPNHPSSGGQAAGGRGRGRRGRRNQPKQGPRQSSPGQPSNRGGQQQNRHGGIYTAPMDHSYRANLQGNGNARGGSQPRGGFGTQYLQPDPEPVPQSADGEPVISRVYAFVDDLFFLAKITETARKLNVKVEFVKTDKDALERVAQNGDQKPSLIIFDLNNVAAKPLTTIPKLKAKLKKHTTVIGFLSHVQGDLKAKATEAGCDMVLPRSTFSQNLPQLLRRHGAPEDSEV